MKEESKIIPTGDVEQLPDNIQDRAALNLNFGKEINILAPENSNESCIADLVNSIDTIPEQQRIIDAKIGVAAAAELSSRGMGMPVNVNSLVSINIMFDDVMKSEIFDAIEVSCQEE